MPQHVRIGTRASALALTQTGHVADALAAAAAIEVETVRVRTDGDRLTGSLASLGGTGVFVTALRDALLDERCDVAVHSLKDLPTGDADGLLLGAVPVREDPRDALCARDGLTLAQLPAGATVGTGSPRRAAQLLAARPDLTVVDIRGNVDTRLGRVAGSENGPGDLDAVVLARAGLARLGRLESVTELFDQTVMLPAPGQGALAIEVRAGIDPTSELAQALALLHHQPTHLAVVAERALLARLEAGCAAPVGALAVLAGDVLSLEAVVVRTDGTQSLHRTLSATLGDDPVAAAAALGSRVADELLEAGAADLADLGLGRVTASPLTGWRVLVPRPTAGSSAAVVALAAAGATAEVVPLIATVPPQESGPLDDALLALGAGWYRWLAVTSAAAVPMLAQRAATSGRTLADLVRDGDVSVAAVGPGTSRALEGEGLVVDLSARPSTAAQLVATWPAASVGEQHRPPRVLFPRGDLAAPTLTDGLRARGWRVDDVVAYRTVPADPPPADVRTAWADGTIRAALLTSASTVRELVAHLGPPPSGTLLVAIGPTTAAEAKRHGLTLAATATTQTMSGLVDALADAARKENP